MTSFKVGETYPCAWLSCSDLTTPQTVVARICIDGVALLPTTRPSGDAPSRAAGAPRWRQT